MKEILGKTTTKSSVLPTKITVSNKINDIFDEKKEADEFNNFFTNIKYDLANKIPNASKSFHSYVTKVNTSVKPQILSINELKQTFFVTATRRRRDIKIVLCLSAHVRKSLI